MFQTWIVTEALEARLLSRAADDPAAYWKRPWLFPIWLFPWRNTEEPLIGTGTETLKKNFVGTVFWELNVHFGWELLFRPVVKWLKMYLDFFLVSYCWQIKNLSKLSVENTYKYDADQL